MWLLNVWASWCVSCREEHPLLVELGKSKLVPIVGLNYKDEPAAGKRWLTQNGDPYNVSVVDRDGRVGIDWGVYGVPETFVVDKIGNDPLQADRTDHRRSAGKDDPAARPRAAEIMKRIALLLLLVAIALSPLIVLAADAVPTEKDGVAAARAVKLAEKLRCLVCQNQTIDDSNAELAQDLRRQIREQIAAGKSDDEIIAYMVARYGDFVLYQPPLKATTVLLWAGPALLLARSDSSASCASFARAARRPEPPPLTAEEHERAERLLAGDAGRTPS